MVEDLTDAFSAQITALTPTIALVFGGLVGLGALLALGRFVVRRVRGAIK